MAMMVAKMDTSKEQQILSTFRGDAGHLKCEHFKPMRLAASPSIRQTDLIEADYQGIDGIRETWPHSAAGSWHSTSGNDFGRSKSKN
ncbi:hypothetical protein [Zavarzinella formosa]|uniref:hypothetical protein n=1 Tax=Zavarzinella formosa TaxID=360055 RepID=UPI0012F8F4B5|nr:hypothetical protein [Zavarzinella formosa]